MSSAMGRDLLEGLKWELGSNVLLKGCNCERGSRERCQEATVTAWRAMTAGVQPTVPGEPAPASALPTPLPGLGASVLPQPSGEHQLVFPLLPLPLTFRLRGLLAPPPGCPPM